MIELLVVIAIIGLLATLSVVALNNARERARDSRRVSDIKQIQTALELYFDANNDSYPVVTGSITTAPATLATDLATPLVDYMNPVPSAPTPADGDCTEVLGTSAVDGNTYGYHAPAGGATYSIYYCLGSDGAQVATPFTIGDL